MKILIAFSLIFSSFSYAGNNCNLKEVLKSMNVDSEINTVFELRTELRKKWGGDDYDKVFNMYISDLNPYFKTDGEINVDQAIWTKQFVDSEMFLGFKSAVDKVKINPKSNIPHDEAKFLLGKELVKLDAIFLDHEHAKQIKIVATHDNVTTYWTHLDGLPVQGHSSDKTWNSIPGAGGKGELVIALHKKEDGTWSLPEGNHGSKNIVLHEFGHSFNYTVGDLLDGNGAYLSNDPEFYRAWYNEWQDGNFKDPYYVQADNNYSVGKDEAFSEGLAKYYSKDGISVREWPHIGKYFETVLLPKLRSSK